MKILVFLDDPNNAREVVRAVARMISGNDGEVEIHLSRVLKFNGRGTSSRTAGETVGAGVASTGGLIEGASAAATVKEYPIDDADAADEYLARLAHRYFPGTPSKRVVFGCTPAAEIIAYVQREDIGLIAIADHGEQGIGRMLLFNSPAPVFKVPSGQRVR